MTPRFYNLSIKDIQRQTPDCVSITFDVPEHLGEAYTFVQGQYITLRTYLNEEELRRSYSICSSPHQNALTIAIKQVTGGLFSTYANKKLKIGDTLDVMTPMGNFFTPLNPQNNKQYVAFASGSGITPIISIIKETLYQEPNSSFTLFCGNKNFDHIIFREELIALKNKYINRFSLHHILSRESMGLPLFKGRLTGEKCTQFAKNLFNPTEIADYFLCGPEEMINDISQTLMVLGVPKKQIHFELFTTPNAAKINTEKTNQLPKPEVAEFESQITVIIDGHTYDFSLYSEAESILEAAYEYGADLPYACKGGVCCTCKAKLLEGTVKMDINYALEPDEVAAGYILTCQSHPQSKRVVLTFDEN